MDGTYKALYFSRGFMTAAALILCILLLGDNCAVW